MRSLLFASALCAAGLIGEAVLAGKNANKILRQLKQPAWALPTTAWYFVGLVYYAGCFLATYRLVRIQESGSDQALALGLIIAVMTANVAWNFLFFRKKNLTLSFCYFLPYTLLTLALLCALMRTDRLSAIVFFAYVLYLPYALAWAFKVWKLNP